MSEVKGYEPSEEETKMAEDHMTEREQGMSEAREEDQKFHATEAEKEKMNKLHSATLNENRERDEYIEKQNEKNDDKKLNELRRDEKISLTIKGGYSVDENNYYRHIGEMIRKELGDNWSVKQIKDISITVHTWDDEHDGRQSRSKIIVQLTDGKELES
ncbi:MAG: hypothetical protein NTW79_00290 [Candidatus Berkelbacteria bacterium]|nr:hypothetical protein [Candidatus Berkelbacteria bacterium]